MRPQRIPYLTAGTKNKKMLLLILNDLFGATEVVTELHFSPSRRWRFDYAVPSEMLAVEYQGHGHTGGKRHVGGHASVKGLANDCEKLNAAMALGWRVIKFTALHFQERDRIRHRLTAPLITLENIKNKIP